MNGCSQFRPFLFSDTVDIDIPIGSITVFLTCFPESIHSICTGAGGERPINIGGFNGYWTLGAVVRGSFHSSTCFLVLSDSVPSCGYRLSVAITTVSINVIVTLSWRRRRLPDTNITGQRLLFVALVGYLLITLWLPYVILPYA